MRLLACLLISLLTACALPRKTAHVPPPPLPRWSAGEKVISVIETVPDECKQAVAEGADWWTERGAAFVLQEVPEGGAIALGLVYIGTILVAPEPPWHPDAAAETVTLFPKHMPELIMHAEIRFKTCEKWHVAHELGHVLGLVDDYDDPTRLMYFTDEFRGWAVPPAHLAHVRD